jgi:phosphoribosyl 1,2-cyclic phosphodiesterase
MIIRCWGSRGSIPVSGKQYLYYGGNTTCLEIRTKNDEILIVDAGSGIRELGNFLIAEDRHAFTLLMTHAHWDHIMGFPFFKPIYSSKTRINVWGCPFAQTSLKEMLSSIMAPPHFPVNFDSIQANISYHDTCVASYHLDSLTITPIALSHPNQGSGYKFEEDGKCFIFLTDNELGFRHEGGLEYKDYLAFSRGADLLIHDAEFDEDEYKKSRGWGHSVYKDALKLAIECKVKRLGLFHHNQERFDTEIDTMVAKCHKEIARLGINLECFAVQQGMELSI